MEEAAETVWYANEVGLTLLRRAALDGYTGRLNGGVLLPENRVIIIYNNVIYSYQERVLCVELRFDLLE